MTAGAGNGTIRMSRYSFVGIAGLAIYLGETGID